MWSMFKKANNDWLAEYNWEDEKFTPDYAMLQQKAYHRLFVYNEWQSKQSKHHMLGDTAIRCATALTKNSNYVVWKKKLGADTFPFALETTEDQKFGHETFLGPAGKVAGQLYLVTPEVIKSLDSDVLNTVQFDRKRISVEVPYRIKDGGTLSDRYVREFRAWAYIGRSDFWLEGHGLNDYYCGKVHTYSSLATPLNSEKISQVYYFYDDKFENSSR
jgi:hypothetical protein